MKSKKLLLFIVVALSLCTALTAAAQNTNRTDQNAPNEIARSRIFGGVHFPTDTAAGQSVGRSVANYVFLNYLTPRRCNL